MSPTLRDLPVEIADDRSVQLAAGESDPERPEWLLRRMTRARAAVLRVVPVVGLADPVMNGRLGEWQTGSEGVLIELSYGRSLSAAGPYVAVRTYLGDQLCPALPELLADERDRLFDHAEIDEPAPEQTAVAERALVIDAMQIDVDTRREDHLWAARAELPPQFGIGAANRPAMVSVVVRGVRPGDVALTMVHDLQPFADAADTWLREMTTRERARPRAWPIS